MICGVFSHGKYRIIHSHCKKMHIGPFIVTLRECTYGRMHAHCIKIDKNRDREKTAYGGRKGMQFMCENKGGEFSWEQWLRYSGSRGAPAGARAPSERASALPWFWGICYRAPSYGEYLKTRVEIGPSIGPTR